MIDEILVAINESEKKANKTLDKAYKEVLDINKQNQIDIENLYDSFEFEVREAIKQQVAEIFDNDTLSEESADELNVSLNKREEAIEYIVTQFVQKYVGARG